MPSTDYHLGKGATNANLELLKSDQWNQNLSGKQKQMNGIIFINKISYVL